MDNTTSTLAISLEEHREDFLRTAESLIPETVRDLIREVEKFAPPVPVFTDHSFVTAEGSTDYACAD